MNILDFDFEIFKVFNSLAGVSDFWDWVFAALAEYVIFLLIAGLAVFILLEYHSRTRWKIVVKALVAGLIARGILISIIRFLWFRPRPFLQEGVIQLVSHDPLEGAFPSGHAAFMFALAFVLLWADKKWGAFYLALAAVSGLARIIVGVHYPLDIAGGIGVGILSAYLVRWLWRKLRNNDKMTE